MKNFYKNIYKKNPGATIGLLVVLILGIGISIRSYVNTGSVLALIVTGVLTSIYHIAFYLQQKKDKKNG